MALKRRPRVVLSTVDTCCAELFNARRPRKALPAACDDAGIMGRACDGATMPNPLLTLETTTKVSIFDFVFTGHFLSHLGWQTFCGISQKQESQRLSACTALCTAFDQQLITMNILELELTRNLKLTRHWVEPEST